MGTESSRAAYEEKASEEWLDDLAHLGTDWRKPHLTDAPWVIVVFAQDYELREDGSTGKHYYVNESVGIPRPGPDRSSLGRGRDGEPAPRGEWLCCPVRIAVGFLFAAVRQAGLVCPPHTPSPMNFLAEELDRSENERAWLLVPIGYPAEDCEVPDIGKQPLEEATEWV